jgi:tetratricopeptide (TPR) repeat protein
MVLSVSLLMASPLSADQNDPRLDNLFDILQSSDEQIEIRAAENLIWSTWLHHGNAEYDHMMRVGSWAMGERRFDQAIVLFSNLIQKAPDYAEAWNKRATVYFMIGDLSLSAKDIDRALALEPRHFGALSGLGQIEL